MKIGLLGLLGLIFVTLKLVGTITWSWWWVLLPFYAPLAVAGVVGGGIVLLALFAALAGKK